MPIYDLGGKKFKVVIEAGRDPATGRRRRITRTVSGRRHDAELLELDLTRQLEQGTYVEPKRITVRDWMNTWLNDYKKMTLRQTTYDSYKMQIDKHIIPAIGAIPIQELRADHLQKLYSEKHQAGLSPRSVRYIHTVIHGALEQAVENRIILLNVSKSTKLPKKEKGEVRALTPEEQERFIKALYGERLSAAFVVLMATGLRRGELLGLRWRNVDLAGRFLAIEENLVAVKGGAVYQPPKTEKSKGRVPLIAPAIEALKSHRERMIFEGHYGADMPVFCSKAGTPINPRNFSRVFERLRDKAGIDRDVTVHSLRHTFATRLLERGVSMREVQELLRHEEMATTADIYSHVSEDLKQAAADRIADLF